MQNDVESEHEELRELIRRIAGSLQEDLDATLDHRLEVLAQGKTGREATADLLDPSFRELVRQALVLDPRVALADRAPTRAWNPHPGADE